VSVRSKFEAQLSPGLRELGFEIKIPDCSKSYKPFDYVIGVKSFGVLRFIAIEAKKATGWTLNNSAVLPHQERALDLLESMCPYSSWLAIGFLDIPKMKRDYDGTKIIKPKKKEAFLIPWRDYLALKGETSISYSDIISVENSSLEWAKIGKRYAWRVRQHSLFMQKLHDN